MVDDLIMVQDQLIEITEINSDSTGDNYFIKYLDEYGEKNELTLAHEECVDLYVYIDSEE